MKNIAYFRCKPFVVYIIFLLLLVSCQRANSQRLTTEANLIVGDGGFLSETPCGPPCFMSIIPGETSKDQVTQFINDEIGMENCEIWDTRPDVRGGYCDPPYISFSFSSFDIVNHIAFVPSITITADEIIKKYGIPSRVSVTSDTTESSPENYQENPFVFSMTMLYDEPCMRIGFPIQMDKDEIYRINESTHVNVVVYYEEGSYLADLEIYPAQQWKGYGEYKIIE